MGILGFSNPLHHNPDLVDADDEITRDAEGQDPSYNQLGPTAAPDLAGDHADDDGQALDDTLIPNSQGILGNDGIDHGSPDDPATPNGPAETPILTTPRRAIKAPFGHAVELTDQDVPTDVADQTTRILATRVPIGPGFDPVQLLPRDPERSHLVLYFDDVCQWGSAKSDVYAPGGFPGGLGIVLDKHNGSVWVYSTSAAAGSYAYAWAVTS